MKHILKYISLAIFFTGFGLVIANNINNREDTFDKVIQKYINDYKDGNNTDKCMDMKIPALVGEPSAGNTDIKNKTEDVNSYVINQYLKLDESYINANPKMSSKDITFCRGYESLIETIDMCRKLSMSENSDYKLAVEKLKYCIDVNF